MSKVGDEYGSTNIKVACCVEDVGDVDPNVFIKRSRVIEPRPAESQFFSKLGVSDGVGARCDAD